MSITHFSLCQPTPLFPPGVFSFSDTQRSENPDFALCKESEVKHLRGKPRSISRTAFTQAQLLATLEFRQGRRPRSGRSAQRNRLNRWIDGAPSNGKNKGRRPEQCLTSFTNHKPVAPDLFAYAVKGCKTWAWTLAHRSRSIWRTARKWPASSR